jgi:hypothetical protein
MDSHEVIIYDHKYRLLLNGVGREHFCKVYVDDNPTPLNMYWAEEEGQWRMSANSKTPDFAYDAEFAISDAIEEYIEMKKSPNA